MIEFSNPNFSLNMSALLQGMWYSELPELVDIEIICENLKDVLYNLSITPLTSFKPEDSFTEKEKRTLCCYAKECGWEITLPQNYRYAYCMVDRIDLAEEWEYILTEITPPFKNLNKKLMKRFQQYIVDLFTKFCAELEAAGYQFFYSIDDESMENVCKTNEWMFLEDGTLFSA